MGFIAEGRNIFYGHSIPHIIMLLLGLLREYADGDDVIPDFGAL